MAGENDVRILLDLAASGNLKETESQLERILKKYEQLEQVEKRMSTGLGQAQQVFSNEIKKTENNIKSLETSTKSLDAEQTKAINGQKQKLNELNGTYKQIENTQNSFGKAQIENTTRLTTNVEKLKKELVGLKQEMKEANDPKFIKFLNVEIARVEENMRKARNEAKLTTQQNHVLENSYSGIVLRNKELREALNRLPINDTSGQLDRLKREFNANTAALTRFDKELGQSFREVGKYEDAIKRAAASMGGLGSQVGSLNLGGGGGQGGGGSILGLASGALGGLGGISAVGGPALLAVGGLVAGFDSLLDSTKAVNAELTKTAAVTKLQGAELKTVTAELRAQANVFGQDYNESLRAANALVKQLGIDFSEAIDLINTGFIEGADINGDFLDTIREYPTFFKEAGLEAQNLVNISILGAQQGIFSDKAVDAVKEGTIRIREMTTATRAAIKGLGLVPEEIEKNLRNGTITIGDAIAQVSEAMGKLPPQSAKVGTAIADIFGGAGEDAGLGFLLTLKDINTELDTSGKNLTVYQQRQVRQLEAQEKLNKAQVDFASSFAALGNSIGIFSDTALASLINGLNSVLQLFISNTEKAKQFGQSIAQLSKDQAEEGIVRTKERLQELGDEMESIIALQDSFTAGGLFGDLDQRAKATAEAIAEESKNLAELHNRIKEIENPTVKLTEAQREQIRQYRNLIDATRDYKTALTPKEVDALTRAVNDQAAAAGAAERAFAKFKEELKEIQKLQSIGIGRTPGVSQQLRTDFQALFGVDPEQAIEEFNNILDNFKPRDVTDSLEAGILRRLDLLDEEKKKVKETQDAWEEAEERKLNAIQTTLSFASEFAFAFADIQLNRLDAELAAVEETEARKLEAVKGNQQAEESIRAESAQRKKQIQQQQAQAERRLALFQIGINIISAVVEALPNIPLSIAVGLLGAAQLAAALSIPIPQFFKGTSSSPEGPALVGEKGWELLERAGKFMFTNDGPQLTYLKGGTKVYTHEQSQRLIREKPEILRQALQVKNDPVAAYDKRQSQELQRSLDLHNKRDNQELIEGFNKAIKQIPQQQSQWDEYGMRRWIVKGGIRKEIMNKLRRW